MYTAIYLQTLLTESEHASEHQDDTDASKMYRWKRSYCGYKVINSIVNRFSFLLTYLLTDSLTHPLTLYIYIHIGSLHKLNKFTNCILPTRNAIKQIWRITIVQFKTLNLSLILMITRFIVFNSTKAGFKTYTIDKWNLKHAAVWRFDNSVFLARVLYSNLMYNVELRSLTILSLTTSRQHRDVSKEWHRLTSVDR